ncbi:MAG: peptide chain release factor N(5)-glutamine methyltransferase [Alphaproteobacteria bacterium]|nr:peptide chain release factor N(5)-glutamine methyltransferase [Alphaproteobacteria bacterium]
MTVAAEIINIGDDVATALDTIADLLKDAGIDTARLDASLLVGAATGESAAGLIARPERRLSAQESDLLSAMTARRCAREPMAQILGSREFWSLDFDVSADVLTPRPDSETLIEAAGQHAPATGQPFRILDLGTGSGCLLLALLHQYPAASGVGVDISPAAIAMAGRNAERLGLDVRSSFMVGDWTASIAERFDIVVSNPPYIASHEIEGLEPEVARYEPRGALDGGGDGLDAYRTLLPLMSEVLAPDGTALFEMGAGQGEAVSSLAQACGLAVEGLRADLAGIPRVAIIRQR